MTDPTCETKRAELRGILEKQSAVMQAMFTAAHELLAGPTTYLSDDEHTMLSAVSLKIAYAAGFCSGMADQLKPNDPTLN